MIIDDSNKQRKRIKKMGLKHDLASAMRQREQQLKRGYHDSSLVYRIEKIKIDLLNLGDIN